MYLMYVDESGDTGNGIGSSKHFILSGMIIAQDDWDKFLSRLKIFRKQLKETYGLNQRTEIHAQELIRINKTKELASITKSNRMNILKDYCSQLPIIFDTAKIINVCLNKNEHPGKDIFELAWSRLLQRFDRFLKRTVNDKGIIVADDTDSKKLMALQRKMRIYNPTPSHYEGFYNVPIDNIIEDPFSRNSQHSYFIQSVDMVAHVLYRKEFPKGSLKKFGLEYQFQKLEPILLKEASKYDNWGIIRR
ncbi:MAG TPA: DUF3800 domain-containing protein [Marinilabiliaceae bacterium]|nr:DUF3800 domain-containing protein [Marinilabiliaceae bacterium]